MKGAIDPMRFRHEVRIKAPVHAVYNELQDMLKWPELIPHVSKIEPIEYDEKKQHVYMSVLNEKGTEVMETIRHFEEDNYVNFHQISMPKPLTKHNGIWKLEEHGDETIVRSIHDIETMYPFFLGNVGACIAWKFFIKKNSLMTLRAVKLKLEYPHNQTTRIVKKSCFIKHSIDVAIPIDKAYEVIGDPKLWPELYPTAIKADILKENDELCEFKLVEYVGKKKFYSHSFLHKDPERKLIYYQHYPPSFPLKYMVIRWVFEKLDETHTRFTILREYDVRIPIIGKLIANTYGKKVIKSHVDDYHRDLRAYEKKYLEGKGRYGK